jgi:hypothetical protein
MLPSDKSPGLNLLLIFSGKLKNQAVIATKKGQKKGG